MRAQLTLGLNSSRGRKGDHARECKRRGIKKGEQKQECQKLVHLGAIEFSQSLFLKLPMSKMQLMLFYSEAKKNPCNKVQIKKKKKAGFFFLLLKPLF